MTDIKGENYRITAKHRGTLGPVHAFAPFDPDIESACFNPIEFIRAGTVNDVDDARLIAEMIVPPEGHDTNHWEREARVLVTGLLLYIANDLPPHRQNLRELRLLLMRSRDGFNAVLGGMAASEHAVVQRIARDSPRRKTGSAPPSSRRHKAEQKSSTAPSSPRSPAAPPSGSKT